VAMSYVRLEGSSLLARCMPINKILGIGRDRPKIPSRRLIRHDSLLVVGLVALCRVLNITQAVVSYSISPSRANRPDIPPEKRNIWYKSGSITSRLVKLPDFAITPMFAVGIEASSNGLIELTIRSI
jgi:hypothetical protein